MAKKIIYRDGKQITLDSKMNQLRLWSLGESLIQRISQSSVNKLDKNEWDITKIKQKTKKTLNETLRKSHITKLKKRVGHILSQEGTCAIAALIHNNEVFLKEYRVIEKETQMYELKEIVLSNHTPVTISVDDVLFQEQIHFKINKAGRVVKEVWMEPVDGEGASMKQSSFIYPKSVKRIPVEIIYNNERGLSDIGNVKMWDAIGELDFHAKEFGVEWMVSRTYWTDNEIFADKSLEQFMESDERVIPRNSVKSKLQEPSAQISIGTQNVAQAMININFIEQKILKYTFSPIDSMATGTNKFNKEIDKFNQDATEYLDNKREAREESYTNLISKVIEVLAAINKPVVRKDMDTIVLKLKLSDMEQGIIDEVKLKADIMAAEAKAKQNQGNQTKEVKGDANE